MLEFADFEQNCYSIISTGIYRIGHDSIRLLKWLINHDRSYYDNMNYFDLMGSICKYLNEKSHWSIFLWKLKIIDIKFIQLKVSFYENEILQLPSEHNIRFKMKLRYGKIRKS